MYVCILYYNYTPPHIRVLKTQENGVWEVKINPSAGIKTRNITLNWLGHETRSLYTSFASIILEIQLIWKAWEAIQNTCPGIHCPIWYLGAWGPMQNYICALTVPQNVLMSPQHEIERLGHQWGGRCAARLIDALRYFWYHIPSKHCINSNQIRWDLRDPEWVKGTFDFITMYWFMKLCMQKNRHGLHT